MREIVRIAMSCVCEGSEVFGSNDGPRRDRRRGVALAMVLSMILALAADGAQAATIKVNSTADDTNPGHCTLREAINSANGSSSGTGSCRAGDGNDAIKFSVRGTITLGSTLPDVLRTLTIRAPLAAGGQGSIPSPSAIVLDGSDTCQVMVVDSGATLTLANLTIENGAAGGDGGGVLNNGTLVVSNSAFSGNFSGNSSDVSYGGGVANYGTLIVANSTFYRNGLKGPKHSFGGGIANFGALSVTDSTFAGNGPGSSGGGIYNKGGTLTVAGSTFSANSSGRPKLTGASGAGIENEGGTLVVTDSTFSTNVSTHLGGGINNSAGTLTVINSTFFANAASSPDDPTAGLGGGINNNFGTVSVTNSTFSTNSASYRGGGIRNGGTIFNLKGTILANNIISGWPFPRQLRRKDHRHRLQPQRRQFVRLRCHRQPQ